MIIIIIVDVVIVVINNNNIKVKLLWFSCAASDRRSSSLRVVRESSSPRRLLVVSSSRSLLYLAELCLFLFLSTSTLCSQNSHRGIFLLSVFGWMQSRRVKLFLLHHPPAELPGSFALLPPLC